MANFTTRVVLHDADWEDYEELHQYMNLNGFNRTITSSDGVIYHLPEAEYNYSGEISKKDVLEMVKKSAARTGKKYSVLITEALSRTWYNLDKT